MGTQLLALGIRFVCTNKMTLSSAELNVSELCEAHRLGGVIDLIISQSVHHLSILRQRHIQRTLEESRAILRGLGRQGRNLVRQ